jgi:hypothetical protein
VTEDEFDRLMKASLSNDAYWGALVSSDGDREQVADWLRNAVAQVRSDKKRREAAWQAEAWQHRKGSPGWRAGFSAFNKWKASAHGFERAVTRRMFELGLNEQGHPIARKREPKPAALTKAHKHAETLQSQLRHTSEALIDLAAVICDFEDGTSTLRDLTDALDQLTMPHGGGEASVRTVLNNYRESRMKEYTA